MSFVKSHIFNFSHFCIISHFPSFSNIPLYTGIKDFARNGESSASRILDVEIKDFESSRVLKYSGEVLK